MEGHAPVLAAEALSKLRRRVGHGDQPADLAGRDGGEVAPDVVVVEPENADSKARGPSHGWTPGEADRAAG
jgi:hypothetical protein